MNDVLATLNTLSQRKATIYDVFVQTVGGASEHAISLHPIALKLYALTVLGGIGKEKEPLTKYDGDLQVLLNKKKFFSTNIGLHFENQKKRVLHDLTRKFHNGTFLFTDIYGLQKAETWRPRLWTVNFSIEDRELVGRAIFGHCDLFPMLPYEVLGVSVVGEWMLKMSGMKSLRWSWNFHSITNKTIQEINPVPMFTQLPEFNEVWETLRIETAIRMFRPKLAPLPNIPLPKELDEFIKEIHTYWSKTK